MEFADYKGHFMLLIVIGDLHRTFIHSWESRQSAGVIPFDILFSTVHPSLRGRSSRSNLLSLCGDCFVGKNALLAMTKFSRICTVEKYTLTIAPKLTVFGENHD
jgi:hypothetical protein